MNDIKTLLGKLTDNEIKAIREAHQYSWSQFGILHLLVAYISDIRHDRENLLNIEHRDIDLEGFMIRGKDILQSINEIRFSGEFSKSYLFVIAKNLFRGTAHPIYEISNDSNVKELLSKVCFKDENHFQNFIDILSVVRHFLSHNYTQTVVLKKWDMKKDSTIVELKKRHNDSVISFEYNGREFFPELYKDSVFKINISLVLSKVSVGTSLFEAIGIKELFFLSELCNNSLKKTIDIIDNHGIKSVLNAKI